MQNNVETQHKHMYSYIGSLCNVALIPNGILYLWIWMQWSIAFSSAFYRGRENI